MVRIRYYIVFHSFHSPTNDLGPQFVMMNSDSFNFFSLFSSSFQIWIFGKFIFCNDIKTITPSVGYFDQF